MSTSAREWGVLIALLVLILNLISTSNSTGVTWGKADTRITHNKEQIEKMDTVISEIRTQTSDIRVDIAKIFAGIEAIGDRLERHDKGSTIP